MVEYIGRVKINYRSYTGSDLYSDGSVEDELLNIVRTYREDAFSKIIAEKQSWPILYHLSHIRNNLVDWLPISKNDTILEIGAGCGGVTGCLADKAKSVTCIELSEKRSLINAYRNQERDNIEILLGNFEDVEKTLDQIYDYITLIGVFEYGALYISGDQPYENFLRIVKKHLKPDGKLIIAIENKLGMKYWAGCREDHNGKLFAGIEGYPTTNGAQTFSRLELEQLLEKTGFRKNKFYYPYPDYKLPLAIYSDEYLPNPTDLKKNVLNFDQERLLLFDEAKAYASVIKAGAFPVFANSYLIIAKSGGM